MSKRHWNKREQEVRAETLKQVMKMIGNVQSEALVDSANYFTIPIHIWEELKAELEKLK